MSSVILTIECSKCKWLTNINEYETGLGPSCMKCGKPLNPSQDKQIGSFDRDAFLNAGSKQQAAAQQAIGLPLPPGQGTLGDTARSLAGKTAAPSPFPKLKCTACKGKGFIITDILSGSTRECEVCNPPVQTAPSPSLSFSDYEEGSFIDGQNSSYYRKINDTLELHCGKCGATHQLNQVNVNLATIHYLCTCGVRLI